MQDESLSEKFYAMVGALVSLPAIIILTIIIPIVWEGYVIVKLWGWFVVPQFDLPAIHLATAVGISCLMSLLATQYMSNEETETNKHPVLKATAYVYLKPALVLLFGWLTLKYAYLLNGIA